MKAQRKKTIIQISGSIFPAILYVINENYKKVDYIHLLASLSILLLLLFTIPILFRRIRKQLMRVYFIVVSLFATILCIFWFVFLYTFHTYETQKGLVIIGETLTIRADTLLSTNQFPTTDSMMDMPDNMEAQLIWSDIDEYQTYFLISYYLFILFGGLTIFSASEYEFGDPEYKKPLIKYLPKLFFKIKPRNKPDKSG